MVKLVLADCFSGPSKLLLEQAQLHCRHPGQGKFDDRRAQLIRVCHCAAPLLFADVRRRETLMLRLLVLVLVCVQTFQIYLGYIFVRRAGRAEPMRRQLTLCAAALRLFVFQSLVRRHRRFSVLWRRSYERGASSWIDMERAAALPAK